MKKSTSQIKKILGKFSKLSKRKKFAVVALVLVVLFFLFKNTDDEDAVTYKTGIVEKGTVVSTVSETGEIMTTAKTDVASSINGIVDEVYVENGDQVVRGQSLFSVTSTATEAERAVAYSSYQSAKTALTNAESNYRSTQASVAVVLDEVDGHDEDESLETKETRTKAEVANDNAYFNVVSAKASLSKAWLAYQATIDGVVKSPASGTVVNLAVSSGQNVSTTDDALIVKDEGNQTWVIIAVNETDVPSVVPGQEAEVSVDALSGTTYKSLVERVDEIGTVDSGVVTYNVYLSVKGVSSAVKPGMTVQVDIQTAKAEDVLVVSNSAIKPYQGEKAVQVMKDDGSTIYLPITVGIVGVSETQVISGLEEGQEIIISSTESNSDSGGGIFGGSPGN